MKKKDILFILFAAGVFTCALVFPEYAFPLLCLVLIGQIIGRIKRRRR